jgi:hypothetical protein
MTTKLLHKLKQWLALTMLCKGGLVEMMADVNDQFGRGVVVGKVQAKQFALQLK